MHGRPLSILHVLIHKGYGGAGRYCLDLAQRQRDAGCRVGFVLRPSDPKARVSIYDYLPADVPRFMAWRPFESFSIGGAAARFKPDVLHAHVGWSARAVGAMRRRPPAVATLHLGYKAKDCARLDGVIRIADWQSRDMADYRGRAETIPNWLPKQPAVLPAAVTALRRELGVGPKDILVGSVGRLHPVKGVDLLVKSFRQTAPANARLVVLGDGPERAALEALADGDPRVKLVGYVSEPAPWFRAFDLFAMPSRFEPFGIAALEAMNAGARIVAADTGGLGEVLRNTPAELVPPDDEAALASALTRFFEQRAAGGPARRIAYDMTRYQGEDAVRRIDRFYRDVIARSAEPADVARVA
ncbi:glycosyltransferase [Caulobacter sp. 17J80-11]|uniref:glycosyltransferase n=1 Tax=Caulobacter sp. 17J80-11 TaxID=2763502 RepID=UPI00165397F1|nr:glycosyltransferase [Caulobacter sp. 17J80-11]MBC6981441.1 glycosyltransferase [Caulobacter sp. 17J80-11]